MRNGFFNTTGYNPGSSTTDLDMITDVITDDMGSNHGHHSSSHAHYPPTSGHMYEQEGALAKLEGVGGEFWHNLLLSV